MLRKKLHIESLFLLKQTHSTKGYFVKEGLPAEALAEEGDYLITQTPGLAIGVITADCLPIVLYDEINNAIAVIHAGWRGAVDGIISNAISMMKKRCGTRSNDLCAYFGPSAQSCCYEVGEEFLEAFVPIRRLERSRMGTNAYQSFFIKRNGKLYFDNSQFCVSQLIELGLRSENIDRKNNVCTICNHKYHSYRRDGNKSGRQLTAVVLR